MKTRSTSSRVIALLATLCVALLVAPVHAGAITRPEIIARGLVWTSKAVPYSQSRYATVGGSLISTATASPWTKGYRTDCSGFVSMCLGLTYSTGAPLSLDTASLPGRLTKITKTQLVPGDLIVRPKNLKIDGVTVPYGHAIVFGGWADSAKTSYWALHESSSAKGAVRQRVTYGTSGFWSEKGFAPYRYAGAAIRPAGSGIFLP